MRDIAAIQCLAANATSLPCAIRWARRIGNPVCVNCLCLLLVIAAGAAHADCVWQNGASTNTYTFNIPPLSVPRDTAVGTVVYTSPRQQAMPATGSYAYCSSGGNYLQTVTGSAPVAGMPNTFATSVPGIGIRFFASNGTSGTPGYFNPANGGTYNGSWSQSGNGGVYYGIELVATGPVGTGTITPGASAVFTLGSLTISILQITSTQVVAQTCQINADSSVDLPKISASALPSNGSTAGRTSFTITLSNCPAQMRAIQYQLDAPGGVINAAAGTFLASGGSTVQGVGLIVTDASDNTFSLATMHTLNQYNPSTGGTYPIGFNLKYFRTGTVSPGTLKAQLTYTFSYQ